MADITRNPEIMGGKYLIAGTRIPVSAIKSFALVGCRMSEIQRLYPTLSIKQIEAAISFRVETTSPTPPKGEA